MSDPQMTSLERVLGALRHESVDRVPWMEGIVENGIASAVCGEPIHVDWSVAPDGFPMQRGADLAEEQKKVNRILGKDNINFSAFAPIFAHKMEKSEDGSPVLVGDGMIRTRQDFDRLFHLPSPEDAGFITEFCDAIRKASKHEMPVEVAPEVMGLAGTVKMLRQVKPFMPLMKRWASVSMMEVSRELKNPALAEMFSEGGASQDG